MASNANRVDGEPTKDFFITMLIKDITLKDAIGDLVDNSIDAIKSKAQNPELLRDFDIIITARDNLFTINDNGSGIEEEIARNYAFKQGKPIKHKLIENSIGRFGIGMKRAFFKLGNKINVKSIAPTSRFTLNIIVDEWKLNENDWNFEFEKDSVKIQEKNSNKTTGTNITITDLSEDARESFKKAQFENELIEEISREQILNINKGITIKINDVMLKPKQMTLKYDQEISPSYWKHKFIHDKKELNVEVFAGISEEIESEGGWNIFCNERLILDRDTTAITGWTGAGSDGVAKYHQQFWGFRGYVLFKAKDSSLLPWNTTKTGIDPDSSDYLAVRNKMIEMMKDVFILLNRQKKEREKNNPQKDQILNQKINASKPLSVFEIIKKKDKLDTKFHFPTDLNIVKDKDSQQIKYSVSMVKYKKVRKSLSGINPSDVGSKTFDYYFENEIDE